MDHAAIGATGCQCRLILPLRVAHTFGVGLTKGNVTGCVFIKQRILEQDATAGDGRGMGDKGDLAQTSGAFIRIQHTFKHILPACCVHLHNAPGLKPDLNPVNECTLVGQRFGAGNGPFHTQSVGCCKHLLGWNVGVAHNAIARLFRTASPVVPIGQPNQQVRAGAGKMQGIVAHIVQKRGTAVQNGVMCLPVGHRVIPRQARDGKNGLPEFCHRLLFGQTGEHLHGPCRSGGSHNAPVHIKIGDDLHGRAVHFGSRLACAGDMVRVLPGKECRVGARNGHTGSPGPEPLRHTGGKPARCCIEGTFLGKSVAGECGFLIRIECGHQRCPGLVGMFRNTADQWHGMEGGGHNNLLTGGNVQPRTGRHLAQPVQHGGKFG